MYLYEQGTYAVAQSHDHISFPPNMRLEERIYYDLLGRIQSGAYPEGSRLPTENVFAEEFGVSRPVIRSALARLREAGLIVSRRGAGSFVEATGVDYSRAFRSLSSIDDIAEYYSFRRLIEGEAAAGAALRAGKADLDELADLQARIEDDIEAGQATIDNDIRFHVRLAQIAGNRFIVESLDLLQPHLRFVARFMRSLTPDGYAAAKKRLQGEHQEIIEALRDKDPEAARKAMLEHINSSENRIFRGAGNED